MTHRIRHIVLCGMMLLMAAQVGYAKEPRLESRLRQDSTIFTAKLVKGHVKKVGETFEVKIHVGLRSPWHIYSSTMLDGEGFIPISVGIPDSLKRYFEIVNVKELSNPRTWFDSSFWASIKANFEPFDIVITVRVTQEPRSRLPFHVYVKYQAADGTVAMPPHTFDVPMTFLGQPPIKLKIASQMKRPEFEIASL